MTTQDPAPQADPTATDSGSDDAAIAQILGTSQPEPGAQAPAEAVPSGEGAEVAIDLTALKFLGVPQSVLDATPKPVLQEWSTQAKERETKRATDIQQRSEETKQLRDELGRFKAVETPKTEERVAPTPAVDLEAELKPIVDELQDAGVPAGKKLASVLKALSASQSAQVEGLTAANKQLVSEVVGFFEDQALSKLEAQFPQLSDPAIRERVLESAKGDYGRFSNLSARQAIAKAVDRAARLELFDDIVKSQADLVINQHRKRDAGQPTAPTRQPQAKPMSDDERETQVAALLQAGKRDEAMRLASG